MSYSSNISIPARHASDLWGVIRLAPFLWGMAPSSNSFSCSTKLQQPISALCFENTSAFQFKTALIDSKTLSPFFPLKCSDLSDSRILVCQILVRMTRGVLESSSSSTSRHCFGCDWKQFFNKFKLNNSFKNFIFIGMIRRVFYVIHLQFLCLLIFGLHRQSVTKFFSTVDRNRVSSVFKNTLAHIPFRVTEMLLP